MMKREFELMPEPTSPVQAEQVLIAQALVRDRKEMALMQDSAYGGLARLLLTALERLRIQSNAPAETERLTERVRQLASIIDVRRAVVMDKIFGAFVVRTPSVKDFGVALRGVKDRGIFVVGFKPTELVDEPLEIFENQTSDLSFWVINPSRASLFDTIRDHASEWKTVGSKDPVVLTHERTLDTQLSWWLLSKKISGNESWVSRVQELLQRESLLSLSHCNNIMQAHTVEALEKSVREAVQAHSE